MRVHVVSGPDGAAVWVSLPETETRNLITAPESFIVGHGATRADALGMAANVLVYALRQIDEARR